MIMNDTLDLALWLLHDHQIYHLKVYVIKHYIWNRSVI